MERVNQRRRLHERIQARRLLRHLGLEDWAIIDTGEERIAIVVSLDTSKSEKAKKQNKPTNKLNKQKYHKLNYEIKITI
jgi:hypothetical protein